MPIDHVNALPPGTRFEEYRLDAVLGAGGFGITYRAYDGNLEKFVALKEYLPGEFATRTQGYTVVPQSTTDAQDYHWGLNRFLDEARTLARFDHPHLNRVHRFFESNGTAYMVLEYVDGETLAERLTRERLLPEESLQRLLKEVLSGLAVVHEAGYVHRDIKPGNLMLREEGGSAVVLDFGAARQAVGRRSQRLTTILTPGYAPIEQYDSQADDVGPWSDIYALGMVAYRCISGISDSELPDAVTRGRIQRKGQNDLQPAIEAGKGQYSQKLLEAIDWAIEVDEGERPQSVNEWQTALTGRKTRKRTPRTISKPTTRSAKGTTQRAGMSRTGMVLIVIAAMLVGAGGWLGWQLYRGVTGERMSDLVTALLPQVETHTEPQTGTAAGTEPQTEIVVETATQTAEAGDTASVIKAEPVTEQQPTKPAPPVEDAEVARLLAAAEADLKARRLTSPVGNNAWDNYQRVLELVPAHPEAVKGMERVIESYMELFGATVEQEDFGKAAGYLAKIRELHPDSPVLVEGEQSLEAAKQARADRLAEQERQRQAAEAARLAELERQRIAVAIDAQWAAFETALAEENLSDAAGILARIRSLNPDEPGLTEEEQRLAKQVRKRQEALERQFAGEMVAISGGNFRMGDLSGDGNDDERPVHSVTVSAFMLGKYEVTVGQFQRFVEATGYRTDAERNADGVEGCSNGWEWTWGRSWRKPGYSIHDTQPVVCVSWNDTQSFIDWLNDKTGGNFRLPTEAEWEYAAQAGSTTKYSWGNSIGSSRANCYEDDCGDRWEYTAPVGSLSANTWGLHDIHGNVWEWVQDCYNDSYVGAPTDGSAWTSGGCSERVFRGGFWGNRPESLRSANRGSYIRTVRHYGIGFRLAQDK